MMNVHRLFPSIAAAALLVACSANKDAPTLVTPDAAAAVRWVNAVPDTMPMDYRFVDVASNSSQDNLTYKAISGNWRRVPPGTREIKVFQTGEVTVGGAQANAPSVVSKALLDTSVALTDGHFYTIVHAGNLKAGASPRAKFIVIEDVLPAPAAGTVAFRFINTDPTRAVDVYASPGIAATGGVTGTPVATNVAFGVPTAWIPLPVTTAPNVYVVRYTAAGTTTVLAQNTAPAGIASQPQTVSTAAIDAVAGSQIGASALTSVYFPTGQSYTVTNPGQPLSTTTNPNPLTFAAPAAGVFFVVDVNPPRISP